MVDRVRSTKTPIEVAKQQETPAEQVTTAASVASEITNWSPRLSIVKTADGERFVPDHPNAEIGYRLLMKRLGMSSVQSLNGFLWQIAEATSANNEIQGSALNGVIVHIASENPRDETEAMLIAQTAIFCRLTMSGVRNFTHAFSFKEQDLTSAILNKTARTYVALVQARKGYRTAGESVIAHAPMAPALAGPFRRG